MIRAVIKVQEKANPKDVPSSDVAVVQFLFAQVLKDQGRYPEAERVLNDFCTQYRGLPVRGGGGDLLQVCREG